MRELCRALTVDETLHSQNNELFFRVLQMALANSSFISKCSLTAPTALHIRNTQSKRN